MIKTNDGKADLSTPTGYDGKTCKIQYVKGEPNIQVFFIFLKDLVAKMCFCGSVRPPFTPHQVIQSYVWDRVKMKKQLCSKIPLKLYGSKFYDVVVIGLPSIN